LTTGKGILIDKVTLETKKVVLGQIGQPEGYGAAMAVPSYEDQFVGSTIELRWPTFEGLLPKDLKNIIPSPKTKG